MPWGLINAQVTLQIGNVTLSVDCNFHLCKSCFIWIFAVSLWWELSKSAQVKAEIYTYTPSGLILKWFVLHSNSAWACACIPTMLKINMLGAIYVSKNLILVQKELELQALTQKEKTWICSFSIIRKCLLIFFGKVKQCKSMISVEVPRMTIHIKILLINVKSCIRVEQRL